MSPRVFVVTGANKGIGFATIEKLLTAVEGGIIYLTSRNEALGKAAVSQLEKVVPVASRRSELRYHPLEVTNLGSVTALAHHLNLHHKGLDVLVNNAGIYMDNSTNIVNEARVTNDINYYGLKLVTNTLLPFIRPGGRIVNLSSKAGVLGVNEYVSTPFSKELAADLVGARTESDVDAFVENYVLAAQANNRAAKGYPESAYRISKAAVVSLTILQNNLLKPKNIQVYVCCPGFVDTDLTSHQGPLTIQEGAITPVYLATDPNAPAGKFVFKCQAIEW